MAQKAKRISVFLFALALLYYIINLGAYLIRFPGPRRKKILEPLIIKKYSNRRLYHTKEKKYITLDQLAELIREGHQVEIIDNQTKKNITQETLLQIILNDDKKNPSLFTPSLLHQLIRLREEHFHEFFRFYLGSSLEYFSKFKENMNQQWSSWGQFLNPALPFLQGSSPLEVPHTNPNDLMEEMKKRMGEYEKKIKDLESKLKN